MRKRLKCNVAWAINEIFASDFTVLVIKEITQDVILVKRINNASISFSAICAIKFIVSSDLSSWEEIFGK